MQGREQVGMQASGGQAVESSFGILRQEGGDGPGPYQIRIL